MGVAAATVQLVDDSTLTPIVRQLVDRNDFNIKEWHVNQIGGGVGNPVSVGLYRFEGTGQDGNESMTWSVILKVIQSPTNMGMEVMGGGGSESLFDRFYFG